jgi:hypothetical protein
MLNILLKDDNWFLPAALISLTAAVVLIIGARRRHVAGRATAAGASNLFFGVLIGILGSGHLFAVTTKSLLGILPRDIHLWLAIPFGMALAGPAWWLTLEVRGLVKADSVSRKRAIWLNAWLALVLASAGPAVVLASLACVDFLLLLWAGRPRPVATA